MQVQSRFWQSQGIGGLKLARTDLPGIERIWDLSNFQSGDTFTITVLVPYDQGGQQFEAWAPGAADGSQTANCVALYPAVPPAGQTATMVAARRNCESFWVL